MRAPTLAYRLIKTSRSFYVLLNDYRLAGVHRLILFSRTPDRVFLITSPSKQTSDATEVIRKSTILRKVQSE